MKTLYLGLDPKNFPSAVIHYPVIRTVRIAGADLQKAQQLWPQFTHVIFTSQTAVAYWPEDLTGKVVIAIGKATREALATCHPLIAPFIAPQATQEGVIALLQTMDLQNAYLFLPRSRLARSALTDYLQSAQIRFFAVDLYDTLFQKPEPVPDLAAIDEIVFTSPSTVEGFLRIYGNLPNDKKLTPIGPVTESALLEKMK